jgi:hypothetical protein
MSESNPTYTITLVGGARTLAPAILAQRRSIGPFAGMDRIVLQRALEKARLALIDVVTGVKPIQVDFQEGTGKRSVIYSQANADQLRVLIRDIENGIGIRTRRALGVTL